MDHFCDDPMLQVCVHCGFNPLRPPRPACQRNSSKFFNFCLECYLSFCSDCAAKARWRCKTCKRPLPTLEYADY